MLVRRVHKDTVVGDVSAVEPEAFFPILYGLTLPRSGDVSTLMAAITRHTGIPPENLILADVYRNRVLKLLDGREPLMNLREDETVTVYERALHVMNDRSYTSDPGASNDSAPKTHGRVEYEEDSDLDDDEEPEPPQVWPKSFTDMEEGTRLDALDYKQNWYVGSVIQVDKGPPHRCLVHFDRFSSKWDEWYDEEHWKSGRMMPPHSKTQPKRKILEIQVSSPAAGFLAQREQVY